MTVEAPTHVVADPGAKRALCGVKKPLPVVWAPFVEAHVRGHAMPLCPACAAVLAGEATP